MMMRAKPVICVTGNIASGKTTIARLLGEFYPDACFIPEPHDQNPFLPNYLRDQRRWGFTAQLRYFCDYVRVFEETTARYPNCCCFVDAGIWTNRLVYGQYLFDEHIITPDEYDFYQLLCDKIQHAASIGDPDGCIFVQAAPQTCWARMNRRGWDYQVGAVSLSYIETLQRYFEQMKTVLAARAIPILDISSETLDYTTDSGRQACLSLVQRFLELS